MASSDRRRGARACGRVCALPSALLSLVALLLQLATPLLHTLGSKPQTAGLRAHVALAFPGVAALDADAADPASHHDAAACPVCRSLQQSRHLVVARPVVALASRVPLPSRPTTRPVPASAPARSGTAPRAPPFFS